MKKAHNTDGVYQSGNLSLVSDEKEGMFIISIFPDKFSTLKESSKEITKEQFLERFNDLQLRIQKELNKILI